MKLSTLISECQKVLDEHGDMDVIAETRSDEYPVQDVEPVSVDYKSKPPEWVLMLELWQDE